MRRMITDLLEYTRTRLGRGIEVVPVSGDFSALCREALEEIEAAHPSRAFESNVPKHSTTKFDPARMRQVLTNLLSNAVQHGDPDSPVALEVSVEGDNVCCEVRNHGKPIPPDALQVIFDPLVQVSPDEAGGHAGIDASLGLGLFIAREIVGVHGGTIGVTSSREDGTLQAPNSVFGARRALKRRLRQAIQQPRTNVAAMPMGVRKSQPGITHAGDAREPVSNSTAHQTPGHQTGLAGGGVDTETVTGPSRGSLCLLDRGTERARKDRQGPLDNQLGCHFRQCAHQIDCCLQGRF